MRADASRIEREAATIASALDPQVIDAALDEAFALAELGPAHDPNPRVGCVILRDGRVVARGFHRGAGHPHAEAEALSDAVARGVDVTGAVAVVTLEPCAHQGRTPACAPALAAARIGTVVYAAADPTPQAAGGAAFLRSHGVHVVDDAAPHRARSANLAWWHAVTMGRPYVTAKTATTLDGRIAAADGTSQWITGPEARAHAHEVRARVGAIIVGTGTVLQDDPALSARPPAPATPTPGETRAPRPPQPLRVVMGLRPIPPQARVRSDPHLLRHFATHNPGEVLDALHEEQIRHVLIEGGASILGAFLQAGLVDELHAYITPMFLGAGRLAVPDLAIPTLTDAPRWTLREVQPLGDSLWLRATRPTPPPPSEPTLPEPTHPEPANP